MAKREGLTLRLVPATRRKADALIVELSAGDAGTRETLGVMAALARAAKDDDQFSEFVRRFARGSALGDAGALYAWMRNSFGFKRDQLGTETINPPPVLLRRWLDADGGKGPRIDCEDQSTFGAAALYALGHDPVFIVYGRNRFGPFEHVNFGARIGDDIVPMDPQEGLPPGRWLDTRYRARMEVFSVGDERRPKAAA